MPVRLLIVDDSALVRKVLTLSLAKCPEIEIVGTAADPFIARDKIKELNPDVMTLDIDMPRMDGLTFLKLVMKHRPMPVIVMSSLIGQGSEAALAALQAGAVDVVAKPGGSYSVSEDTHLLVEKIKAAAKARVRVPAATVQTSGHTTQHVAAGTSHLRRPAPSVGTPGPGQVSSPAAPAPSSGGTALLTRPRPGFAPPASHGSARTYRPRDLIVMGASTGGTEALKAILTKLPADLPPIAIVQHIPAYFSKTFADRLNQLCQMEVREAVNGDRLRPGLALIAPGGFHMVLRWNGGGYSVELNEGPQVHHQRPAVDVLFDSAAKCGSAPHTLAVLLTGMGSDGAAGMLHLKDAGATTFAQDEESCVVFGMPREAIKLGAAQHVLPLEQFAARMDRHASHLAGRAG
jgi:two-component system, chemotaxis family, protein-glutamate methylesterase/glutaminase